MGILTSYLIGVMILIGIPVGLFVIGYKLSERHGDSCGDRGMSGGVVMCFGVIVIMFIIKISHIINEANTTPINISSNDIICKEIAK